MDDGREDHKIETHNASMHMDEENVTNIGEKEAEASVYETEQDHINVQGIHCNVDGEYEGESHYDETRVDDNCKVRCERVNPATTYDLGIFNEHMHA